MSADVGRCGCVGRRHDPDRTATRHGTGTGRSLLGGRRVPVSRPRVRAGTTALRVSCRCPAYELFSPDRSAGPDGDGADAGRARRPAATRSGSNRSVQRVEQAGPWRDEQVRGVADDLSPRPRPRLAELLGRATCPSWTWSALMIDGVHFGEHLCVVALGIGIDGTKHPLAPGRGLDREHHPWSPSCSSGCASGAWTPAGRSSSASTARTALRAAVGAGVRPPGDRPLPTAQDHATWVTSCPISSPRPWRKRMRRAYHAESALAARGAARSAARRSSTAPIPAPPASPARGHGRDTDRAAPGRAAHAWPARCAATNSIESMISIARTHSRNVKNWQTRQHGAALVRRRDGRSAQASSAASTDTCTCPLLRAALDEHVAARNCRCRPS